jgi:hypothetical protein
LLKWKEGPSFEAITLIRADEVKDDKVADEEGAKDSIDDDENEDQNENHEEPM